MPTKNSTDETRRRRRRVFLDMDGVLVDFQGYKRGTGLTSDQIKRIVGAYRSMEPLPGMLDFVQAIVGMGYDVWIATKPATGVAHTYSEKVEWVLHHLPFLRRKIIITHDKGLLGEDGDYLIDDRPHKANCQAFKGTLIHFDKQVTYASVLSLLTTTSPNRTRQRNQL